MKASILLIILISTGALLLPFFVEADLNDVKIEMEFSPEPEFDQIVYGKTYIFVVNILNVGLDIEEDEILDTNEPHFKFSGDLILDVVFTVRRQGSYNIGREIDRYNHTLDRRDETDDISLPEIDGSNSRWFSYSSTTGYDGNNAFLDEWLTFSVDVYAYIEEYRVVSGDKKYYIGDLVGKSHQTFYIISDEKKDFVEDTIKSLDEEINIAKYTVTNIETEIEEELSVDLSKYEDIRNSMIAHFQKGDYVSVMKEFDGVDLNWKEDTIGLLQERVKSMKPYEQQLKDYSEQFSELSADYQDLQSDYDNLTQSSTGQIDKLTSEVNSAKSRNRMYLFGVILLAVLVVILLMRTFFQRK